MELRRIITSKAGKRPEEPDERMLELDDAGNYFQIMPDALDFEQGELDNLVNIMRVREPRTFTFYSRKCVMHRLQAFMSDSVQAYAFSGQKIEREPVHPFVQRALDQASFWFPSTSGTLRS